MPSVLTVLIQPKIPLVIVIKLAMPLNRLLVRLRYRNLCRIASNIIIAFRQWHRWRPRAFGRFVRFRILFQVMRLILRDCR